jgi:hypothetical protein
MSLKADLYQQFDPLRPLEADEEDLYVNWQADVGSEDVKERLAESIALSGTVPVCRLFTGHLGIGKTTELKRVKRVLETGEAERKVFVSLLRTGDSIDLQDASAPDIALQIARQLVDDLTAQGFGFAATRFSEFFGELGTILSQEVELKNVKIPGWAELGFTLKGVPEVRPTLRRLLSGKLPTINQRINEQIVVPAREWLKANGNFQDILVIVDDLEKIPRKVLAEDLTNHENIFLDHSNVLKSLACDLLYTVPIELAYSSKRKRLELAFAGEIMTLGVVPVTQRGGGPFEPGLRALRAIVEGRTKRAKATLDGFFADPNSLDRLCMLSGGHVRNLFVLLRSCMERCRALPVTPETVEQTVRGQAMDLTYPLSHADWAALRQVHEAHKPIEDQELWFGLLQNLYVFGYRGGKNLWYDWNPLLGEVPGGGL